MRKREGMKKRRSRILAWLLACFMVLSVIQGTGWGSLTVQAEESNEEDNENTAGKNVPQTLSLCEKGGQGKEIISGGTLKDDGNSDSKDTIYQGTNWYYDSIENQLVLNGASINYIICVGGDLSVLIYGENNTVSGAITSQSGNGEYTLEIKGVDDGSLIVGTRIEDASSGSGNKMNLKITDATVTTQAIICNGSLNIDNSHVNASLTGELNNNAIGAEGNISIVNSYVQANTKKDYAIQSKSKISISDSQILAGSNSTYESAVIDEMDKVGVFKNTYSNCIITKQWKDFETNTGVTKTYVYGTATLKENLTIASGESIDFASGASITNLGKLTVEDGATIQVDDKVHTHNIDGGVTCEWKDADTHVQKSVCKDCPIAYIAETEQKQHNYNTQGFCTECDAYQPAVLTTDQYDINGDNSKDNVYEISNAGQLYWFAGLVNGTLPGTKRNLFVNAVLKADIVINKNVLKSDGTLNDGTFKEWTPIELYGGIFDGQNHTISGIYFNHTEKACVGLFGEVGHGSQVSNVRIMNSYINGQEKVGGVCGYNDGIITNCSNTGTVSGQSHVGGVCGYNNYGTITNCNNAGTVNIPTYAEARFGGVCGYNDGTMENCNNTGSVNGHNEVGGVCGHNGGIITNCSNVGVVSGTGDRVGGVSGNNYGTITNCSNAGTASGTSWQIGGVCGYNYKKGTITNCNNTGKISGISRYVGGVIGYNVGTIKNCYYDSVVYTGKAIGVVDEGTVTNVEGKTTEQYKSGEVAYLLQGDQKDSVWGQTLSEEGGDPYPVLGGKKVYQNQYYDSCVEDKNKIAYAYSNEAKDTTALGHDYVVSKEKSQDGTSVTLKFTCQREGCTSETDKHEIAVTLTSPEAETLVYDKTAKEAIVTVTPEDAFDSVTVSYEYAWDGDSAYDKPVYAGNYTATVTVRLGEEEARASIDYTIQKAKLSVVNAGADKKTYDGTTKVQITNVSLAGALENDEVVVDTTDLYGDLSDKNAGTYSEITLPEMELVGSEADNYELIQPTNPVELATDVTIDKASMNLEDVKLTSVYTGQKLRVDLDALLPEDCGAITYDNVKNTGGISYEEEPVVSDEHFLTFVTKGGDIGDTGRITIDVSTTNYTNKTVIIDIILVDKIPVYVKVGYAVSVKNASLTYGQTLSILKFEDVVFEDKEGNAVKGTLAWKNPDKVPEYGTHSEEWIFTPEDSIYDTAEGTISVSVEKATPEVTELPTVMDRVYHPGTKLENSDLTGGKVLHVDGTEMPGSWWVIDKSVLTVDKQEYQVRFQPSDLMDKTNYIYPDRMITVSVTKATPYITEIPTAETLTYGESLKDAALTGGKVQYSADEAIEVAGTFTWKLVDTKPTVADSDSTNYIVVFTPDDSVNYATVETPVCVTVQKASKAPNMPEASMDVDYTKTTVGSVLLPTGWKFEDTKLDTALEIDKPVTVTANYVGEDAGNYEVESVEITLTRKACTHPTTKWIVDKEATVDAEGSRLKECTVCKTVLATETIAKLEAPTPDVTIRYTTHVQTYGWQGDENNASKWFVNGKMAGTSGKAKRLEGIKIRVYGNDNLGIQYTTHCQSYGWLPWSANGEMNGTEGEAKRLEAIKIQLTGADKDKYDVYYRVHAQSYGWLGWAKNGAPAGTAGYAKRLEGIQIVVVKKGAPAPGVNFEGVNAASSVHQTVSYLAKNGSSPVVGGQVTSNTNPSVAGEANVNIAYRTHVQSFGWQGWKYNGVMSGTSGKAKRLEGINIKLTNKPYSGSIVYTTHVQSIGWQGNENNPNTWFRDGQMAGTSGRAKRLEAIRIALTGEMAEHYDVYYRVHAQTYGWLAWAKNGEAAGTAGLSKRLEGIQIVLVPKGGAAPANNYGGVVTTNKQTYIKK